MADWTSGDSNCAQSPSPLWLPSGRSSPENWKITWPSGPVTRWATPCSVVGQVSSGASASMLTFCQLACATQVTEGPSPVGDSDQLPDASWNTKRRVSRPSTYHRMPRRTSSAVSYTWPQGSRKVGSFWKLALKVVWQITLAPLARQVAPGGGSGTKVVGSTGSLADAGEPPSTRPAHDIASAMSAVRIRIAASLLRSRECQVRPEQPLCLFPRGCRSATMQE